jgi:signal transduction histidine kinase
MALSKLPTLPAHGYAIASCTRRFAHTVMLFAVASVVLALLAGICLPAIAAGETRNVLVLYSNGRLLPANIEADRGLREAIRTPEGRPVIMYDEFLDVPRFGGEGHTRTVATYLREKYSARPPDVIVAASDEALRFLLQNRAELFPQAPVVHMAVPRSLLRSIPELPADVVGVPIEYGVYSTLDQALRWHPKAQRLVLVTGSSEWDHEWETRLRDEVSRFKDRATVEFLAGLPTEAVLKRLAELGGDAVVFTPGYFQDGEGRHFTPRQSVEAMAVAATAPVYGPFDTFMGTGIVGGYMPRYEAMGRQVGQIVIGLLGGAAPDSLRLPEIMPTTLNVDWRQIRRWGIDEKAIPADAVLHFKAPTFLEQYRNEAIIAAVVFLLQAGLIAGLLAERYRRRLAEQAVQTQRFELVHASRLAVAGELTGSIAHEINQPLGAILSNADAADLILESGADRREELHAILADIRRDDLRASEVIRRLRALLAKQEVERQPFELNEAVREVESLLSGEARRRRVTIDIRRAETDVTMVGDRIQIQQVLINLILNAMDAVADMPENRRTVVVSVENGAGGIAIAVCDRGHGIAPEHLPKLFDSFFSTKRKGMGLGLSIARTLVESHGGRIWAENGPGDGVAIHVKLPAASAMSDPSEGQA